jgi:gamma-glutamylcyclotransferase (GGCT)/AIG2-like uncharacterized protein YtfP
MMSQVRLFVYGTLAPSNLEDATATGWMFDRVRGRLFDLGRYPGLVDLDDPTAGWVEGFVGLVDPDVLVNELDPYEGVDQGLYVRVRTETESGTRVWIYVYSRPLPRHARGPLTRWNGHRRAWQPASLPDSQGAT